MIGCSRLQRYKLLKAIHNGLAFIATLSNVVPDYKDTNFWKQFTTNEQKGSLNRLLFQTTKIQTFESNSQPSILRPMAESCCFRLQRYKLLKAIHNLTRNMANRIFVVSDYKDTNFWKQFTTRPCDKSRQGGLFQTTKIQIFERNSQRGSNR